MPPRRVPLIDPNNPDAAPSVDGAPEAAPAAAAITPPLGPNNNHVDAANLLDRPRAPQFNPPAPFDGNLRNTSEFVSKMRRYLRLFNFTPQTAVIAILNQLTGDAAVWARYLDEDEHHEHWNDPNAFLDTLSRVYFNSQQEFESSRALMTMNGLSPQDVIDCVYQHRFTTRINEEGIVTMLLQALPHEIAFNMTAQGYNDRSLSECLERAALLVRLSSATAPARHAARPSPRSERQQQFQHQQQFQQRQAQPRIFPTTAPNFAANSNTGPRPALTLEERDRRLRENLCFRCASPHHHRNQCPGNRAASAVQGNSLPLAVLHQ